MPGKTARALCPVCQEPMPPDETECANCGAFVIDEAVVRLCRAFGINREKALALFEKGFRHPTQLKDRDPDDVLTKGENGLLFLCTNCGGFVASGDTKCPRCNAEFEEEIEAAPTETDILDLVLCPVCGADNEPEEEECEICGETLRGLPPEALEAVPAAAGEALCPRCGTRKAGALAPCPVCDAPKKEEARLEKVDAFLDGLEDLEGKEEAPALVQTELEVHPAPKVQKISKVPRTRAAPKPPPTDPVPRVAAPKGPVPATAAPAPKIPIPRIAPPRAPAPIPPATRTPATPPRPATIPPVAAPEPAPRVAHPRPQAAAAPRPEPRRGARSLRRTWTAPPPEVTGAVVTASAASLYLSSAFSPPGTATGIAWGVAAALAAISVYAVAASPSSRVLRATRTDFALLAAGVLPGLVALVAPAAVAPFLIAVAAIPLALATRRLRKNPARAFLVGAAAIGLLGFAIDAALGLPLASTPAWTLGLAAYAPWPAILVAGELRRRRLTSALRTELSRAERDISRQDYARSLEDYDRAIELSKRGVPGEDLPWYGKGATLVLLGRYEEALRAIDVALDINPRNEVAWLNKGNALMKLGRHLDALRCFNAALRVNPSYEVAWNNKGNALARMGHYEEALLCYERALTIDPDYRGSWVNKGYVLTKLGRYEEAASCADRALRLDRRLSEPA